MWQNRLLTLSDPSAHRTKSELQRWIQKSTQPTAQLWQAPLQRVSSSSAAVLEVKTRWAVFFLHARISGKKAWKGWNRKHFVYTCSHVLGNSLYKQVIHPPQDSCSNQKPDTLPDDSKMAKGQTGLKDAVTCTAQFSTVCGAIPHLKGMMKNSSSKWGKGWRTKWLPLYKDHFFSRHPPKWALKLMQAIAAICKTGSSVPCKDGSENERLRLMKPLYTIVKPMLHSVFSASHFFLSYVLFYFFASKEDFLFVGFHFLLFQQEMEFLVVVVQFYFSSKSDCFTD